MVRGWLGYEVMSSERPAFYCCMLSYLVMEYRYLRRSADELLNFGYEGEMGEILLENFTGVMAPQSCLGSASSQAFDVLRSM